MRTILSALIITFVAGPCGLAFASPIAADNTTDPNATETTAIEDVDKGDEEEVETATMSIPVEEGDVIDLRTPTDVKIETWDGDEVLLIVEKIKRDHLRSTVDPVIRITRSGRGVRIETTGPGWQLYGDDVSFRLVLPADHATGPVLPQSGSIQDVGALSRWTLRVWRVVHKEALRRLL